MHESALPQSILLPLGGHLRRYISHGCRGHCLPHYRYHEYHGEFGRWTITSVLWRLIISLLQNTEDFLNFLEISNARELSEILGAIPQYLLPLPSVTMMLVSMRLVLLWAINLSCLICVIRGVRKMLRNELMRKSKAIRPDFGYDREINHRREINSPNSIEVTIPENFLVLK